MVESLSKVPELSGYKKGDVVVIFGELFSKGYANGVVEEAKKRGLTVVYSTVGRRDQDGGLRPLTEEEAALIPKPFINKPLEAGFDREPDSRGQTPCDQLKGLKMKDWEGENLNWDSILESRENGIIRFKKYLNEYLNELESYIPKTANVLFVHTMAGGVPRAKIIMPVMNRVFKGRGDRFIPSEKLFLSQLGKFSQLNFSEVTAHSFKHLVEMSQELRESIQARGGYVSYVAYSYHGAKILMGDQYQWQTYTPYFQGWAKMELEQHSRDFNEQGIACIVFNCPEILTNSSGIFQGVEVSLYPLLGAIEKEGGETALCREVLNDCRALLKEEHDFKEIMDLTEEYMTKDLTLKFSDYSKWPQHNSMEQMTSMLDLSDKLIAMHRDPKNLMTFALSEKVFKATGSLILHQSWQQRKTKPVLWLNHDIIAGQMAQNS